MDNDATLLVTGDDGQEKAMTILFTFDDDQHHKSYVLFYDDQADDGQVYAMEYDGQGNLMEVSDDAAWQMIEETFNAFMEAQDETEDEKEAAE